MDVPAWIEHAGPVAGVAAFAIWTMFRLSSAILVSNTRALRDLTEQTKELRIFLQRNCIACRQDFDARSSD